jgi:hypothetical protein
MTKTMIVGIVCFIAGILTGIIGVTYAHLRYKKGLQVWSIRRKLHKGKTLIKATVSIIFSGLYRVTHRRKVSEKQNELYEFLETFETIQELKFLDYICKAVIKGHTDEKEIRLPCRENLREILQVGKNSVPDLIKKFEEQGILRVASNFSDSLKRNKGGNNQGIFVLIDKDKAMKLLELSEIAKKANMVESKRTPFQKYPKRLKKVKIRG